MPDIAARRIALDLTHVLCTYVCYLETVTLTHSKARLDDEDSNVASILALLTLSPILINVSHFELCASTIVLVLKTFCSARLRCISCTNKRAILHRDVGWSDALRSLKLGYQAFHERRASIS